MPILLGLISVSTFFTLIFYQYALQQEAVFYEFLCHIAFFIQLLLASVIMVVNGVLRARKVEFNFAQKVQNAIQTHFKQVNQFYNQAGLHWHVVDNHLWIELYINKKQHIQWRRGLSHYGIYKPQDFKVEEMMEDSRFEAKNTGFVYPQQQSPEPQNRAFVAEEVKNNTVLSFDDEFAHPAPKSAGIDNY